MVVNKDLYAYDEGVEKALPPSESGPGYYRGMAIQPIDYIMLNDLNFIQGNIIKYTTRAYEKGTLLEDIRKIIHYAEMWLDDETNKETQDSFLGDID